MIPIQVTLTRFTSSPVQTIEQAASQCYQSEPTPDGRIMKQCYASGHESVLEHVSFTWEISGVSRALLAQLTRHRFVSFSVQSQRYCDMKNGTAVIPPMIANNPQALHLFFESMSACAKAYSDLQELGIPNEDARYVLQNSCTTSLTCTMNLREFIHLCNERLCARAQWEIRELVRKMVDEVNTATDNAFADMLKPKCERDKNAPMCPESKRQTCGRHPCKADVYKAYEHIKKEEKRDDHQQEL